MQFMLHKAKLDKGMAGTDVIDISCFFAFWGFELQTI